VPRDRGTDWGFEDVTDHYVAEFHGIDARQLRKTDPERALDLARATVAHIVESTFAEWRRQGSSCRGALIFTLRDLVAGAGWGLLDAQGRPKASWYAAARAMQPVALLVTDEGVNGLHLHLVNDTANDIEGTLAVTSCSAEGHTTESGSAPVVVPARGHHTMSAEAILGGFRDITYAYRFGPPAIDSVGVEFRGADLVRQAVFLPGGQRRPQEPLGLEAKASASGDSWDIDVRTERLAQWVAFDVPGRRISDSWFNLAGGSSHRVRVEGSAEPRGTVRALNGVDPVAVTIGR
jgi:beta-mannosidase